MEGVGLRDLFFLIFSRCLHFSYEVCLWLPKRVPPLFFSLFYDSWVLGAKRIHGEKSITTLSILPFWWPASPPPSLEPTYFWLILFFYFSPIFTGPRYTWGLGEVNRISKMFSLLPGASAPFFLQSDNAPLFSFYSRFLLLLSCFMRLFSKVLCFAVADIRGA